jgi:hypothetical protein
MARLLPLVMDSGMNVSGGPIYTRTDSNGNRITINARAAANFLLTSVVDTLGTTGVSSTGTPPSAVNYTYASPSGASVSVVATYVMLHVQLAYGCSNASGFGPQSNIVGKTVGESSEVVTKTNSFVRSVRSIFPFAKPAKKNADDRDRHIEPPTL